MRTYSMPVSNHAGDLAALLPLLRCASKGITGIETGTMTVKETITLGAFYGTFYVTQAHAKRHLVKYHEETSLWTCNCSDFQHRRIPFCKHIVAVLATKDLVGDAGIPHSCEAPF